MAWQRDFCHARCAGATKRVENKKSGAILKIKVKIRLKLIKESRRNKCF
jgi:hypothetical protein